MTRGRDLPSEAEEQAMLLQWARLNEGRHPELRLLFHIPNGGKRSKSEAGRFKMEGVKAGVPDLMLPVARGNFHGLFIELKRQRDGRVSEHQKAWIEALRSEEYAAIVCCGWEAAAEIITGYLAWSAADRDERRQVDGTDPH